MTTPTHNDLAASAIDLARELIRRPSVTPDDAGCQQLIGERLRTSGFQVTHQRFGAVDNLWARHGDASPTLVLLGHTDVVPPGDDAAWQTPPFAGAIHQGRIWGRGAADMKGSVAAMVVAAEAFVRCHPDHHGSIALLLTSDEEGPAIDGTRRMVEWLTERGERIDYCIVGEPSSTERAGDTVRVGRRGTLSGELTVHGVQGHVAYPQRARNPVHELAPALTALIAKHWDDGDDDFPPTSFQVSNLHAGTGADNVIPATAELSFNFRYGTASPAEKLQSGVRTLLDEHDLDYALSWRHGGEPFRTPPGPLRDTVIDAVRSVTGSAPETSTAGGTSDGRFVAPTGAQVLELGPCNATIHQVNEHVALDDLATIVAIQGRILEQLLLRGD